MTEMQKIAADSMQDSMHIVLFNTTVLHWKI